MSLFCAQDKSFRSKKAYLLYNLDYLSYLICGGQVSIKQELTKAWEKAVLLQQELANQAAELKKQKALVEKEIDELAKGFKKESSRSLRLKLLTRLCLLSELSSAVDFDSLIEAREKFKKLLPRHFDYYLSHLETMKWRVSWSGCLECRHFSGQCALNLTPVEAPDESNRLAKFCPQKEKRSPNL